MATKYSRLFPAVTQFQVKDGQLNVAGRIYVHLEATDDLAPLYDENGTQLTQPVILDNNGRAAGLFVDAAKVYWLDVQDRYGMSLFTIRKMTPCGGSGGSMSGQVEIVSSDGTIAIDKFEDAGVITYDLSVAEDSASELDWIRCDGSNKIQGQNIYRPIYASGTMSLGEQGILLGADRYYHVTAHVRATKTAIDPFYDNFTVNIKTRSGSTETGISRTEHLLDFSLGLTQDFEVSTDVFTSENCELLFEIVSVPNHVTYSFVDVEVHRVYSGIPQGGGGTDQVQSDWTEENSAEPSYILHKPEVKTVVEGENIDITEGENTFTISADLSTVQSQIDTLSGQISTLQSALNTLSTAVNGLQTTVGTLQSQMTYWAGQVNELSGRVSTNTSNLSSLDTRYGAHGNNYDSESHRISHVL